MPDEKEKTSEPEVVEEVHKGRSVNGGVNVNGRKQIPWFAIVSVVFTVGPTLVGFVCWLNSVSTNVNYTSTEMVKLNAGLERIWQHFEEEKKKTNENRERIVKLETINEMRGITKPRIVE